MAGPVFSSSGALALTSSGTSLAPAKPTVDSAAGLLVASVCSKNNATHTTVTPGWTKIAQTNSGASFTASIWIALESAAAPTFSWTGAAAGHAQIAYYSDPANGVNNGISVTGTTGSGTTSTHTSTGFNSDAADTLAIYTDACAANTAIATPAGWTENVDNGSATSTTRQAFGSRSLAASGSASGNVSIVGGAAAWVQFQIEIKGLAAAPGFQVSKLGVGAFVEPPAGFDVSKVSVSAWLETNDVRFSKLEVAAWLDRANRSRRMSLM